MLVVLNVCQHNYILYILYVVEFPFSTQPAAMSPNMYFNREKIFPTNHNFTKCIKYLYFIFTAPQRTIS